MNQRQNDFDQWIRKLADEAESPFHEASWLKMEELLDNKKKKRVFWWIWPLAISGTILVSALIYFLIRSGETLNSNAEQVVINNSNAGLKVASENASLSFSIKSTIENSFIETTPENRKSSTRPDIQHNNSASSSYTNRDKKLNKNGETLNSFSGIVKPGSKKMGGISQKTWGRQSKITRNEETIGNKSNPGTDLPLAIANLNNIEGSNLEHKINDNSTIAGKARDFISVKALANNGYLLNAKVNKLQIPVVPNTIEKPKLKVYSSLILSIHGSPEITSVPSRSYGSTSKEYGFNVSYQFTPRLSLTTGLQKTNKLYSAKQGDYEIPNSDYLYNKVIENIDGICKVIEWPVTVGYKFKALGNNYFQLNAGLASARMDKETYAVDYSYWKGGRVNRKVYGFDNKNWELWSSAIFSIAYIKPISKHWSLSLNPYLKTPLKGIGNGNINLQSVGAQIGINYSIPTLLKD